MAKRAKSRASIIATRFLLGAFGGGLTAVFLIAMVPSLAPPAMIGISSAVGVAVAIVGPKLLELLMTSV